MGKPKGGNGGGTTQHSSTTTATPTATPTMPAPGAPPGGKPSRPPGNGGSPGGTGGTPGTGQAGPGGIPAGPPPKGGSGFLHVPQHIESGAKGIDSSAARIQAAHSKLSGVLQAKGAFWNKDGLGQAFGKVFEPLSTGHMRAGGALQQAVSKTAGNVRTGSVRTDRADASNASKFGVGVWSLQKPKGGNGPGSGPGGNGPGGSGPGGGPGPGGNGPGGNNPGGGPASTPRTPVYHVDENGRVRQLVNGQLVPVNANDASGIRRILDPNNDVRVQIKQDKSGNPKTTPKGKPIRVPVPGGKKRWDRFAKAENRQTPVRSQPLTRPNELSRAVEDTRRVRGDYGRGNYAALHYQDGQGADFILVGNSGQNNSDSERAIGLPMVHNGMQDDVRSLYTERAPCQVNPPTNGIGCDIWVDMHFNRPSRETPLEVNHAADFDSFRSGDRDRNGPFDVYIGELTQRHAAGDFSGLAGTRTYRYP